MHTSRTSLLAWTSLFVAVLLWCGVGFFAWTITDAANARVSENSDAEVANAQQSAGLRLHAIARDTKDARAELESIAGVPVAGIIDTIDAVAKDGNAILKIGQALSSPAQNNAVLHSLSFVVEAQGSFPSAVRVAKLLSSLSLPASVEQIQFERTSDTASPWGLVIRMHVLTTADLSI